MATTFPASLDVLANPTSTTPTNSTLFSHAEQHANANDAIEAIQAKIGIDNSADANSIDYKLRTKATIVSVPATATSNGTPGHIAFDQNYIYVCVGANTWARSALATW